MRWNLRIVDEHEKDQIYETVVGLRRLTPKLCKNHIFFRVMPHSYLKNYEVLSCRNLNDLRSTLSTLTSPYDFWIPKQGFEIDAFVRSAPVGGLNLIYANYGADVPVNVKALDDSGDYLLLCILTSGAALAKLGADELDLTASRGLVRDGRRSVLSEQIDFGAVFLTVPFARLKSHLRALLGEQADTVDPAFAPTIDLTSTLGQHLRNTILFTIHELDGPLRDLDGGLLTRNLETLLLNQIVCSLPNAHSDPLRIGSFPSAVPYHVKRARDYIHAHAEQPILMEDLSKYAGCSIRTLQAGFRDVLGSTPMAYLKSVRLERIRRDLLEAEPGASVAALAMKWGFAHHGNFAKAYKAKFGVPPFETMRFKK